MSLLKISAILFLSLQLFSCGSDAPEEQDVKPPNIYLGGSCDDTCFREAIIMISVWIIDDHGVADAKISFNSKTSTIELDDKGTFLEYFETNTCPDSDNTICENIFEVTAIDLSGNSASETCRVTYVKLYVPHELIVKFIPDTSEERKAEIHAGIGAEVLNDMAMLDYYLVLLPVGISVEEGIEYYESQAEVEFAEPNHIACLTR